MTVNCAHRGASAEAPENTMAAFELAVAQGAEMIELDTRLSLDGYPVVIHDGELERTTTGAGTVEEKLLADLRLLDAGAWFDSRFKGQCIPRLSEVIDFAKEKNIRLDIEMKFSRGTHYALSDAVGALLERTACFDRCIVSSFNHASLDYVKRRFPKTEIARLYYTHAPRGRDLKTVTSAAVWHMFVVPSLVKRVHRFGGQLHVYTVDDANEMRRMIKMGVDTLMTNRPVLLSSVLAEMAE